MNKGIPGVSMVANTPVTELGPTAGGGLRLAVRSRSMAFARKEKPWVESY